MARRKMFNIACFGTVTIVAESEDKAREMIRAVARNVEGSKEAVITGSKEHELGWMLATTTVDERAKMEFVGEEA